MLDSDSPNRRSLKLFEETEGTEFDGAELSDAQEMDEKRKARGRKAEEHKRVEKSHRKQKVLIVNSCIVGRIGERRKERGRGVRGRKGDSNRFLVLRILETIAWS